MSKQELNSLDTAASKVISANRIISSLKGENTEADVETLRAAIAARTGMSMKGAIAVDRTETKAARKSIRNLNAGGSMAKIMESPTQNGAAPALKVCDMKTS